MTLLLGGRTVRDCFPALAANPGVAYLDSASTTQKPAVVIEAARRYLGDRTANAGRGAYPWATRAARQVEDVRARIAGLIGAAGPDEVIFTSGATASLNAVALCWGLANLDDGDEILYNPLDHASNVAPWRNLQRHLGRRGVTVHLVPYAVTAVGEADIADVEAKIGPRTRLITTSHLHNVFGSLTTLEELDRPLLRCFDCSQSAGHVRVDVSALRADFAAFSGHKMFAAPGIGALYVARRHHDTLMPFLPGGDGGTAMPRLLEGGTPNLVGIATLGAAVDVVTDIGVEAIAAHDRSLTRRLVDRLAAVRGVEFLPGVAAASCDVGYGIVSFRIAGIEAADVGFVAASHGLYVRTGTHCLPGAPAHLDSVRVSTHAYTSPDEVDRLADLVRDIAKEVHRP
ncbi:aminotransferase class V-fold PLP-dependent enzyme [Micromonospora sp. WMMD975]|uniref:aminotransferase class V-fold PLP-dependent enzyme n=1 Tax=Micromonospora sp. WMMD975 TaxID=3016087 RepID=UPI00249AE632|nr:aminotransferase class V-fold PLP-dependent enzyme [Micromonospora sp. WMMD975]WFE30935.1 aminotransferase class V-fold PLP-dependent enzyme [Micromonospora sp. WMMD975]